MTRKAAPYVRENSCKQRHDPTIVLRAPTTDSFSSLALHERYQSDDPKEAAIIEESRMDVLIGRRKQIRAALRSAENIRNFRISTGLVPDIDPETGRPEKSDGKVAVSLTAVLVAIGAVVLRLGGRAALISAVGLDFVTDNPELKENLDQVLAYADQTNPIVKVAIFTAAWTAVKVTCFDTAGIGLALASGILFGGVLQGAVASAAAATFGSSVAFALARLDTPVRRKAVDVLEEYPSLRGIEKVVAEDGLKAILTLRLAPILPIPIGMYNYLYGVTNVPFLSFCGGIFLGSLKPYLLDSYLGYFGMELVEGSADASGLQDIILLAAFGISVLIGVFSTQLASETFDSVMAEVEAEKKAEKMSGEAISKEDEVTKEVFGFTLPPWMVGFQYIWKEADRSVQELIDVELEARVWNYTETERTTGRILNLPSDLEDPARRSDSPEILEANQGIDVGLSLCESLVLAPQLTSVFFRLVDPFYSVDDDEDFQERRKQRLENPKLSKADEDKRIALLQQIEDIRKQATERIKLLDERLQIDENK
ncbi:hypothetical protein ACA910_005983 [Epithemia clementina (nom. ined.)]